MRGAIEYDKAVPFRVTFDQLKGIVNGEIKALYRCCSMNEKAELIMDYSKLGQVHDAKGGYCPMRGEWLEGITVRPKDGAYARYQSGQLKCIETLLLLRTTKPYYLEEEMAILSDYGFPDGVLYRLNAEPEVTLKKDGVVKKIKWKKMKARKYARYFLTLSDFTAKPVIDVTEEEAIMLGFRPTDEPITLPHNLTLQIDEGATARNAFFIDYYNRAGDQLRKDPFIYLIKFELHKR